MRHRTFYYKSKREFDQFYFRIKQVPCPFCKLIGLLILNGKLPASYQEQGFRKKSRGHRIFCSNRNKQRNGCGKSFSAIKSDILKGYILSTHGFWTYIFNLLHSKTIKEAFFKSNLPFSVSTAYRLWQKLFINQSRLRVLLTKICRCPSELDTHKPVYESIIHLKVAFSRNRNPIAAFQRYFQEPFLI